MNLMYLNNVLGKDMRLFWIATDSGVIEDKPLDVNIVPLLMNNIP